MVWLFVQAINCYWKLTSPEAESWLLLNLKVDSSLKVDVPELKVDSCTASAYFECVTHGTKLERLVGVRRWSFGWEYLSKLQRLLTTKLPLFICFLYLLSFLLQINFRCMIVTLRNWDAGASDMGSFLSSTSRGNQNSTEQHNECG